MLLRRKQNRNDDAHPIPHAWNWQATGRAAGGRSKPGTKEFSKLSAQMVELSLQEAQRERTLRGASPNNPSTVAPHLFWPTDIQNIARSTTESVERPGTAARKSALAAATPINPPQAQGSPRQLRIPNFAVVYSRATVILRSRTKYWNEVARTLVSRLGKLRVTGSAALGNLRGCWNSVHNDQRLATFRARIVGRFTIAAQRTELILQRTEVLIGRWTRRTASTVQFLAERISAKLRVLRHSQAWRRLTDAFGKILRVLTARASAVCAVMKKKVVAHLGWRHVAPMRRPSGRNHLDQK